MTPLTQTMFPSTKSGCRNGGQLKWTKTRTHGVFLNGCVTKWTEWIATKKNGISLRNANYWNDRQNHINKVTYLQLNLQKR